MIELLLIGVALFGALGFFVLSGTNKVQKKAEANADQILDAAFDGSPDVTFTVNMQTLKPETVILGAKHRGYALLHQVDGKYGPQSLIFTKEADSDTHA